MCNRYGYLAPVSRLVEEFSQVRLPILFKDGAVPNLPPRDHIRPTNNAPILRPLDGADPAAGLELLDARWWLIPFFHRKGIKDWKPMCTNARAETVATTATYREAYRRRRCLVPATHFFEWTGPKGSKTMWRFARSDAGIFCFPGLWERAHTTDGVVESFTLLTCAPGPDCAPYHDRQPVILGPERWADWLDLTVDPADFLKAGEAGGIVVERAVETV
ncbi:MAG TPA: SOS response-associated peptidase [Caulobacteraceae bacterium]|jgi:putative SOS response-associated peptidase YedK|nr:SOS response-associated peptidase [Caulobacteraceae bacterium]